MKIEDLTLQLDGYRLPCRIFMPENANKNYCVLWIQGWTSSMDSHKEGVERMSSEAGLVFATLDFAGHGLHQMPLEQSTRRRQLEEVVALFDELTARGFKKIIVIGGSFGGYMAALLTGKRPVHTAVLRAPAMYPDEEFELEHSQTRKWQNPGRHQSEKAKDAYIQDNEAARSISKFDGSVYVVEHELDEQVPRIMPQTYFSNAKLGNYLVVPKTMHSPKLMKQPKPHFEYIENLVIAIIKAAQLEDNLTSK